jgi:uncharacterized protein YoxC
MPGDQEPFMEKGEGIAASSQVEDELHEFEDQQTNVTRTLQMIVYPAMVAFIILAAYGFYLVQSLTTDVHRLTETISAMNDTVHSNMSNISGTMNNMTSQMGNLVDSTSQMTNNIVGMNGSTQDMAGNIQQMNASTQNMAVSTYNMQRDMWSMNKNISGPMKMFNKFSPFGDDKTSPYVVPPPAATAMPYYNYSWPAANAVVTQPVVPQQPVVPVTTTTTTPPPPALAPGTAAPAGGNAANAKDEHSATQPENEQIVASST